MEPASDEEALSRPRPFAGIEPGEGWPAGSRARARGSAALEQPLTALRGIGPKLADRALRLGISSLGDLLWHLPHQHLDRSRRATIGELEIGERAAVEVSVASISARRARRRGLHVTTAAVEDESGRLKAVWFGRAWLAGRLEPGVRLRLHGRLEPGRFLVEAHEELEGEAKATDAPGLVPVHPAGAGLSPERIRSWVARAVALARWAPEPLPASSRARLGLAAAGCALNAAHFPASEEAARRARRRLAFEEILVHQVALRLAREQERGVPAARSVPPAGELVAAWRSSLPFVPTGAQRRAMAEIGADLEASAPMRRLLMGDVGSGKTVVALDAMLRVVEGGGQAALMAPTASLAEQHALTIETLLGDRPSLSLGLLTGSIAGSPRRRVLDRLAAGEPGVVVGTQALIERAVERRGLALCVIDEQHRFGVAQRSALTDGGLDGRSVHCLHMSATPIPRTLSLTAYGDLDVSVLDELPPGRRPVETRVVSEAERAEAFELVARHLDEGRQAYVVCPLVEESPELAARACDAEAERLAREDLTGYRIVAVHGRLNTRERRERMSAFARGEVDVLVATTVVEVGIDVPNATVMLIEGAERFGLAQLHQLRGRVGRSGADSCCILVAEAGAGSRARRRLSAIAAEGDGFRLAEIDLELRGEGELLGTMQHGSERLRAASLPADEELIELARAELDRLLLEHESLDHPVLRPLADAARTRHAVERTSRLAA